MQLAYIPLGYTAGFWRTADGVEAAEVPEAARLALQDRPISARNNSWAFFGGTAERLVVLP